MTKRAVGRRQVLRAGGAGALALLCPPALARAQAAIAHPGRILVVLELSGGNDGLNTLVPYGDDAYYRHRPTIGIAARRLRRIDDHFGFNAGMAGFERLYKDGHMAVVHGCGYAGPSFSHFTSMAYWHTAAPNSGAAHGWVGRLADAMRPDAAPNFVVNIDTAESLAVRSRLHTPVVFDAPDAFARDGAFAARGVFERLIGDGAAGNAGQRYLRAVARGARDASRLVRAAWSAYRSPVDYGIAPIDLPKIAALIAADLPARLYYTSFRNNAFDTHVHQPNLHGRLLTYASDAVAGFMRDMARIGRADDVAVLVFSEFGRRVPENTSRGTDHGTANLMFVVGHGVKGGHYGAPPSLTALDDGDNLVFTTDFRRVYASVIEGWLGYPDAADILPGRFDPLPMFG